MQHLSLPKLADLDLQPLGQGRASLKLWLVAVPPLVTTMAGDRQAMEMGLLMGVSWFALLLLGVSRPLLTAILLPALSAAWFISAVLFLPFNSPVFVVDSWASLAMLLMSFPRTATPLAHAPR